MTKNLYDGLKTDFLIRSKLAHGSLNGSLNEALTYLAMSQNLKKNSALNLLRLQISLIGLEFEPGAK